MRRFFVLAFISAISIPIVACNSKRQASINPVVVETLISATESWNGDTFRYPKGKAQMTLQKIIAQPGFKTPLHVHPQPGIVYVLRGTLSCETNNGKVLKVSSGDSFASSQNTVHYCENNGNKETVVFVTSAGVKDKQITVSSE